MATAVAGAWARTSAAGTQEAPIGIGLGEAAAPPDAQVVLPVTLTAPDAATVGVVDIRITLPAGTISFAQIDPSGLALGVSAVVRAETSDEATGGTTVVEARISTIEPGGTRQSIPQGPVAYLTFRIGPAASPGDTIEVPVEASAQTTDDPPRPIASVTATAGRITVASPPVPMCFFYMH